MAPSPNKLTAAVVLGGWSGECGCLTAREQTFVLSVLGNRIDSSVIEHPSHGRDCHSVAIALLTAANFLEQPRVNRLAIAAT